MSPRFRPGLVSLLILGIGPSPWLASAGAQTDPDRKTSAAQLDAEAFVLFERGKLEEARQRYELAHALDPLWQYAWNAARCDEMGEQPEAARAAFTQVLSHPGLPQAKLDEGRQRLAALEAQLGSISVKCTPEHAALVVSRPLLNKRGFASRRASCPGRLDGLDPGPYLITASAPDHLPQVVTLQLEAGSRQEVSIRLLSLAERPGWLHITSSVAEGNVEVDGVSRGVTDLVLELPPGQHQVSVTFFQQGVWSQQVTVPAGAQIDVRAEPGTIPAGEQIEARAEPGSSDTTRSRDTPPAQ